MATADKLVYVIVNVHMAIVANLEAELMRHIRRTRQFPEMIIQLIEDPRVCYPGMNPACGGFLCRTKHYRAILFKVQTQGVHWYKQYVTRWWKTFY